MYNEEEVAADRNRMEKSCGCDDGSDEPILSRQKIIRTNYLSTI